MEVDTSLILEILLKRITSYVRRVSNIFEALPGGVACLNFNAYFVEIWRERLLFVTIILFHALFATFWTMSLVRIYPDRVSYSPWNKGHLNVMLTLNPFGTACCYLLFLLFLHIKKRYIYGWYFWRVVFWRVATFEIATVKYFFQRGSLLLGSFNFRNFTILKFLWFYICFRFVAVGIF